VDIVEYRIEAGDWATLGTPAMAVRERVFIIEQGVPATIERDARDPGCRHVVAFGPQGEPIGTGRLLPGKKDEGHIGRMAVMPEWRGKGVGRALLERLLELAGPQTLALHSQSHAMDFYRPFGFVAQGDEYLEAGIPHVTMVRQA
jgi:predicted GNAT family N-acyltransferase